MSARCDAVEANFAWFSQQCSNEATATTDFDGKTYSVCPEHTPT